MNSLPRFHAFDPCAALRIYRRNLPHWRQNGATYFVTFRLADSIPAGIVRQWTELDRIWLHANGVLGPLSDPRWRKAYEAIPDSQRRSFDRTKARRLHLELDRCHGNCRLATPSARETTAQALRFFDGVRLRCGDFVIMPNHVHWLLMPLPGFELELALESVKKFSARRIRAEEPAGRATWQRESYDHVVRSTAELRAIRGYIADNPKKAGLEAGHFTSHRAAWLDEV